MSTVDVHLHNSMVQVNSYLANIRIDFTCFMYVVLSITFEPCFILCIFNVQTWVLDTDKFLTLNSSNNVHNIIHIYTGTVQLQYKLTITNNKDVYISGRGNYITKSYVAPRVYRWCNIYLIVCFSWCIVSDIDTVIMITSSLLWFTLSTEGYHYHELH